jgi:hypothetical protein
MKYIKQILEEFSPKQRLVVLIILLAFMSLTCIITTYLKSETNQCTDLIKENRELLKDLADATDFARKNLSSNINAPIETRISGKKSAPVTRPDTIDPAAMMDPVMMVMNDKQLSPTKVFKENLVDSLVKITSRHAKLHKK